MVQKWLNSAPYQQHTERVYCIFTLKIRNCGGLQHLASGSMITLRYSEPVSDSELRRAYLQNVKWIAVSPLPCPPRTGRGGNPQQLGSHKKVFKRKYKIPDWSGLGDHVTEPRQAAGLSSCGMHALIHRGRGWGTVPSHWLLSHHLLFSWKRRYSPQDKQVPGHGETANIPWQKKSLEGQMPVSRWNQSLGQICSSDAY